MQRLNFQLKTYIKAVELIAKEKGLSHVKCKETTGSVVRFELFEVGESDPCSFWIIHYTHDRKRIVWSKEDYRKAADRLSCTMDYFIQILESL